MSIEPRRNAVPGPVSDLFFNLDLDHCIIRNKKGEFEQYDEDALLQEAEWFADCIGKLSGDRPRTDDIIADFYGRI